MSTIEILDPHARPFHPVFVTKSERVDDPGLIIKRFEHRGLSRGAAVVFDLPAARRGISGLIECSPCLRIQNDR